MANEYSHCEGTFVEFVTESRETLLRAEALLAGLGAMRGQRALAERRTDADRETIQALFRCFHSLKGASSFLKLQHTAGLAHAAQTLVDMYQHDAPIEQAHVRLVRQAVTTLRGMLDNIEADYNDELDAVDSHEVTVALGATIGTLRASKALARSPDGAQGTADGNEASASKLARDKRREADSWGWAETRAAQTRSDPAVRGGELRSTDAGGRVDQLSVGVAELDALSRLADELVVEVTEQRDAGDEAREAGERVKRLTVALREAIAAMRLVPLRETFKDLAAAAGRVAARREGWLYVEMRGEETRVDRTVVVALGHVLVSVVLSALEPALDAAHAGRRAFVGKLVLGARSEGDEVWISLRDGGAGECWFGNGEPKLEVLQRRVASLGGELEWTSNPGAATSCTVRIPRLCREPRRV
jgi:two-component system chemotaxis sensor kinase CheA